jgi:hypothetical protein
MDIILSRPLRASRERRCVNDLGLTCPGAAGTVTGSRHLPESGGTRILLDCGVFRGRRDIRTRNRSQFGVPPSSRTQRDRIEAEPRRPCCIPGHREHFDL